MGGEAQGKCVFNDQTVQFNFGVKDYGDLNRSYSNAYILFVDDVAQFDFDINPLERKKESYNILL